MGYRNSIYKSHDIMEGAIVEEITKIIKAHLSTKKEMKCEFPYNKIDYSSKSKTSDRSQRADFVIKYKKNFTKGKLQAFLRSKDSKKTNIKLIKKDIDKLTELNVNDAKRYVLIISSDKCNLEEKLPPNNQEKFSIIWKGETEFGN